MEEKIVRVRELESGDFFIEIPKEIIHRCGFMDGEELNLSLGEDGDKVPVSVTGSKFPWVIIVSKTE